MIKKDVFQIRHGRARIKVYGPGAKTASVKGGNGREFGLEFCAVDASGSSSIGSLVAVHS